jgi:hypothetical protein
MPDKGLTVGAFQDACENTSSFASKTQDTRGGRARIEPAEKLRPGMTTGVTSGLHAPVPAAGLLRLCQFRSVRNPGVPAPDIGRSELREGSLLNSDPWEAI